MSISQVSKILSLDIKGIIGIKEGEFFLNFEKLPTFIGVKHIKISNL